jgi:hypothetical protein
MAMVASGLMDLSVVIMLLFSAGEVQSNVGSAEKAPGLGEPMLPAPTVCGGLSHPEGPIHSSEGDCWTGNVFVLLSNIKLGSVFITKKQAAYTV